MPLVRICAGWRGATLFPTAIALRRRQKGPCQADVDCSGYARLVEMQASSLYISLKQGGPFDC
jgi:hypothetical protein